MTRTTTIDWPALLSEIALLLGDPDPVNPMVRVPIGSRRLSDALGFPRETIRGWQDGSEPRHADGEVLLLRWCVLTGKARTFAPTTIRPLSASALR